MIEIFSKTKGFLSIIGLADVLDSKKKMVLNGAKVSTSILLPYLIEFGLTEAFKCLTEHKFPVSGNNMEEPAG